MAGRPKKQTVDYFPHFAEEGQTLYILEARYGNDGYAFWFKLLSRLCKTAGHVLDANNPDVWEFMIAKARITGELATEILNLLARIDAIDKKLWEEHRLIWSQNLVNNLKGVYQKRDAPLPERPIYGTEIPISDGDNTISDDGNRQSKVKKSKVEKSKELFKRFWAAYPKKKAKPQAEKAFIKIQPDEALLDIMLISIEKSRCSRDWCKEEGKYIPYPATWLNQRRWEDEEGGDIGTYTGHNGETTEDRYRNSLSRPITTTRPPVRKV